MSCFFDIEHKNVAWGFQHTGHLILSDGSIRKYDLSSARERESDSGINIQLKKQNSKFAGQIESYDMETLCTLLRTIADQPLNKSGKQVAHDAGLTNYYGYLWNPSSGLKKIHLRQEGDFIGQHRQKNADILVEKLQMVSASSRQFSDSMKTIYLSVQPHGFESSNYANW